MIFLFDQKIKNFFEKKKYFFKTFFSAKKKNNFFSIKAFRFSLMRKRLLFFFIMFSIKLRSDNIQQMKKSFDDSRI